jgi:hypothetical protein
MDRTPVPTVGPITVSATIGIGPIGRILYAPGLSPAETGDRELGTDIQRPTATRAGVIEVL